MMTSLVTKHVNELLHNSIEIEVELYLSTFYSLLVHVCTYCCTYLIRGDKAYGSDFAQTSTPVPGMIL